MSPFWVETEITLAAIKDANPKTANFIVGNNNKVTSAKAKRPKE
jgi:hypothetical protein